VAKTLPLFKLGLGGRIGSGQQYWSWISLTDEIGAITFLLDHEVSGPVNLTGPEPVTNAAFTKSVGRALHRPTVVPVPKFGPRLLLGREAADEVVGFSQRVMPMVLAREGYRFRHETVDEATTAELT
jgi:NAD dependent epimerase/dehydratase family enzyme